MGLWKSKYNKGILLAGLITFLPFLIYIHLIFNNSNEDLILLGFQLKHRFISNEEYIWNIMLKIIPIILFSIWFITSTFQWRLLILIPIVVYFDSLIRYTILTNYYSEFEGIIISIIVNILVILFLVIVGRIYQIKYGEDIKWIRISKLLSFESKKNFITLNNFIERVKQGNNENSNNKYFQNLYIIKEYLEQKVLSTPEFTYDSRLNSKLAYILTIAFLSIPILFNIHRFVPNNLEYLDLKILSISSFGFPSVDIFLWLLFLKLTFLLALSIWFVTCQYWWKYAILSPIVLVSYQIWEIFQDVRYIDAWGNLRAFPFILFNIITLIILSNYVRYELKVSDLQKAISRELDDMIGSRAGGKQIDRLKEQLNMLRAISGNKRSTSRTKLDALIKLREDLLRDSEVNR